MVIHFYIRYKTEFGQSLAIIINNSILKDNEPNTEVALQYLNDEYWHGSIDINKLSKRETITYQYILREHGGPGKTDQYENRMINIKKLDEKEINVFDDWQETAFEKTLFNTRPFLNVFGQKKTKVKDSDSKNPSHIFEVKSNHLPDDKLLCITGSAKKMNNWETDKPLLLKKRKDVWTIKLNLNKEDFPIEYKFGVYDINQKKIIHFEDGSNRLLNQQGDKTKLSLLRQFVNFKNHTWKGAGVNVQLSALKTKQSWGIGDFTDLNLLTDWAKATGTRLIQLLPINDTTANHDRRDSYPYSAISAFALHPVFLNIQKLATAVSLEFPDDLLDRIKELNDLPTLDYEAVSEIKKEAIRELYEKDKFSFKDDFAFFDFFDLNRHWLVPYAAFCYLRDKYKTADFNQWPEYNVYDEDSIQEFVSPEHEYYDEIAIHYFTQFHLHLQLLDAVEYAHKHTVILKGDLPIGVGRFSVDTWMNPQLFHMDMQAGAPPDAFAVKGQNWSFPTYNWELMQQNDYAWWRQRMEHMSNYFDAIRIDHVLGFFRIWSIPMHAIDGIFGMFMPTHPLYSYDFETSGIHFNEDRFCKPWITDNTINEIFGEDASWVRETFFDGNSYKEKYNTQRKIEAFFKNDPARIHVQQGLFDLLANVILLKDEKHAHQYHFRIAMQQTASYKNFSGHDQYILNELYRKYFFETQNELWFKEAQTKLDAIQRSTNMLICAEDLGMVPDMVEDVLKTREILALQVQRMPKVSTENFTHPANAPYLCVVTPSTHDMSTLREWWEEDRKSTQDFYNHFLGQYGTAPFYCEPWISKDIIKQHLQSPAMWAIFLLQDIMGMHEGIRRENPKDERINFPADPNHYWNYRMHITLEALLEQEKFSEEMRSIIEGAGR
ncbi:MAG: 4-alpha-glucanotransferase [Ferruginibacter sp.]